MLLEKVIKCPSCNQSLKVTNKKQMAAKVIKCPKCGASIPVSFKEEDRVPMNQPQTVEEETHTIYGPPRRSIEAYLELNGYQYPLEKPENVIGRKASTSQADIQIDSNDPYMGRHHAMISQRKDNQGFIYFYIKPRDAKNGLTVNNIPIGEYDEMTLMDGAQIRMGRTILTFKIKLLKN